MDNFLAHNPIQHSVIAVISLIIAIFLIRTIFRATFKLLLIVGMIGFMMISVFGYTPNEVFKKGKEMASYTNSYVESTLKPAIYNGLKNAHIEKGPNGTVELIGDQFEIGQTPDGRFIFHVNSLNISISQDELSKYLNKDEMEKLLHAVQDKQTTNEL